MRHCRVESTETLFFGENDVAGRALLACLPIATMITAVGLYAAAITSMAIIGVVGVFAQMSNGWPERFPGIAAIAMEPQLAKENADKVTDADKGPITAAIEKVKQAARGENVNAIRQAINDLQQASQAMAQHLHSRGQGPQGPGPEAPAGDGTDKGKEDVIDAEFTSHE